MHDSFITPATEVTSVTGSKQHVTLDADIIIKNAPDPVFVSDLARF